MRYVLLELIAKAGSLSLADLATRFLEPLDKLRDQLRELEQRGEIIVEGKASLDLFLSGIDKLETEAAGLQEQPPPEQVSREHFYQFLNENPSFESTNVRLSSSGFHTATG